ncbi:hypothetical protein [uncultured Zobellia sp.]|uniref:hypothetical protein n=1 Tax=uncultured Zobellia sp. TaxID=255433 RepID=UPI002592755A|nr:hypothetical protein [uncultured Zobellia sp.]
MKKITPVLFLFALILASNLTFGQEIITNEKVIEMKELGFDDDIIIEKIYSSPVDFDTSIAALSVLKKAGVSSEVMSEIMRSPKNNTSLKPGIYYSEEDNSEKLILATVFSSTDKNSFANRMVSGYIPTTKKSRLPGTNSNNTIPETSPSFKFVFERNETENPNNLQSIMNRMGMLNWWFRTASSPNEFILVKLDVNQKKKFREIITGKRSAAFENNGVDAKHIVDFTIETIDEHTFMVHTENLEYGEYAFMYQGQVPMGAENQSVFDFSIQ